MTPARSSSPLLATGPDSAAPEQDFVRTPDGWRIEREQVLRCARSDLFAFFVDPKNLETILPPHMRFRLVTRDAPQLHVGLRLEYRFTFCGFPMTWVARIARIEPGVSFVDEIERGPFTRWTHLHELRDHPEGTLCIDRVDFKTPLGPLGRIAESLFVRQSIVRLFEHRQARLREIFEAAPAARARS